MHVKFILVFSCIFLVYSTVLFVIPALCYSEGEAKAAVAVAESEILSCYQAAFDAEKSGANVSSLLRVLNEAGWLLSRAKLAYSQGDFGSAVEYANECRSMLDGFVGQAEGLRRDAEAAGRWDFLVNFVGSAVGAVCVVVGGFAVWVFLRRREAFKRRQPS